ncbi:hypothetical protein HPB52_004137 [Rhipicephalus sanguineus]|uniref:Uncharacterized protein n=1 Tax=Rhipicephalus sanguineus TaxID=34632 RepID=A0A9D4Q4M7_RHISA|nr:hypothetical protein HPB52_004137 [Rhipicephalus sanguineus]
MPHRLKTRQRNEGPVMLRVSGPPVPKLRPVLPSAEEGIILDIWLGAESVANICTDIAVILLLRKAARMTRVLGAFVAWNTVALLLCCGGNLIGLRFPPKWPSSERSVTVPDLSTLPDNRSQPASAGSSVKRPLAVIKKSQQQTGASAFANAQLLAKILARQKAAGSAGGYKGTDVSSRPASSAASCSNHPSSDVPQPRQPVGGVADPRGVFATSQVLKTSGELPEESLPNPETTSKRCSVSAAYHSSEEAQ